MVITLPLYQNICDHDELPAYMITKRIPVEFSQTDTTKNLWQKHKQALKTQKISEKPSETSLLDLKIELSKRLYQSCSFCEHNCRVNRETEKGFCDVSTSRIASEFIHNGEEPLFIPSHTIFFSGCTFKCVFCQNWDISQFQSGIVIPPDELAKRIEYQKKNGSRNVNWVGGDPTSHLKYILQTLKYLDVSAPQIWNSNMYCSQETMDLLNGIIDVYLADFKFGKNRCAEMLSGIDRYNEIITRNLLEAEVQAEVFIRHLILPNHISCCSLPILYWVSDHLPKVPINIMNQYRPSYKSKNYPIIDRAITQHEYRTVVDEAKRLDLSLIN